MTDAASIRFSDGEGNETPIQYSKYVQAREGVGGCDMSSERVLRLILHVDDLLPLTSGQKNLLLKKIADEVYVDGGIGEYKYQESYTKSASRLILEIFPHLTTEESSYE